MYFQLYIISNKLLFDMIIYCLNLMKMIDFLIYIIIKYYYYILLYSLHIFIISSIFILNNIIIRNKFSIIFSNKFFNLLFNDQREIIQKHKIYNLSIVIFNVI